MVIHFLGLAIRAFHINCVLSLMELEIRSTRCLMDCRCHRQDIIEPEGTHRIRTHDVLQLLSVKSALTYA